MALVSSKILWLYHSSVTYLPVQKNTTTVDAVTVINGVDIRVVSLHQLSRPAVLSSTKQHCPTGPKDPSCGRRTDPESLEPKHQTLFQYRLPFSTLVIQPRFCVSCFLPRSTSWLSVPRLPLQSVCVCVEIPEACSPHSSKSLPRGQPCNCFLSLLSLATMTRSQPAD